ncbi:peptide/nickel transport system ATP-binding protein [Tistlia consotensis]|uniref:Peptide/nickel transport system ATP-binding protein n=1 Tax=Tistlia consotensis USBA 355 TaxID=560819 RepID=A0A1Y6BXJ3_9PROT|nr:oligopeptide/dipeptide ABC transporter ATP-binding protein [Tistlia consotensis]SMF25008.1 peptide/nickel transport system ATP-binding protein [Tistlia consotensis USBA 355]SNR60227.1 peptide/nickel transport system ATP-binding protein [Tistlia consotensis]
MQQQPLISASGLVRSYRASRAGLLRRGPEVRAVDGVSFAIRAGEAFGLVGESGSGKTTVGRMVSATLRPDAGTVALLGEPFAEPMPLARRAKVQAVFQDSLGALNPRLRIGRQLEEPLIVHGIGAAERRVRIDGLLADVGLPRSLLLRYPGEVSGGQRQRVLLARALALRPDLLVCDEPVSALDVSVQAQVVNLLADLKTRHALTLLFISHDLRVVRHLCDRVAVLFAGRIVESGAVAEVIGSPAHPYTRALIRALPADRPGPRRTAARAIAAAPDLATQDLATQDLAIPDRATPDGAGCAFAARCAAATPTCRRSAPVLRSLSAGHEAACHLVAAR